MKRKDLQFDNQAKIFSRIGRLTRFQVLGILLLLTSQIVWFVVVFRSPDTRLADFRAFDTFATASAQGLNPYALPMSDLDRISRQRWGIGAKQQPVRVFIEEALFIPYSPLLYAMLRPLTALPPLIAANVWYLFNCLTFFVSALFVSHWRSDRWIDALMFALVAAFAPVLQTLSGGQINAFLLLGLALTFYGLRFKLQWIVGLGVAVFLLLKLLPTVFVLILYLLWRREAKSLGWLVAWAVALLGITLPLVGFQSWIDYGLKTLFHASQVAFRITNSEGVNIWTFLQRVLPASTGQVFATLFSLVIAALALFAILRDGGQDWSDECSLLIVGSLLISPVSWLHYQVMLLVPAAVLLRDCSLSFASWKVTASHYLVFLSLALLNLHALTRSRFKSQPWLSSWGTFALTILFGVLLWRLIQPRGIAAIVNPVQERRIIP